LALSIFHYTNDDRGVTTTRRYAEGTGWPGLQNTSSQRELCSGRAWGKQSNWTPSSRRG
jgi:hypothetical protein